MQAINTAIQGTVSSDGTTKERGYPAGAVDGNNAPVDNSGNIVASVDSIQDVTSGAPAVSNGTVGVIADVVAKVTGVIFGGGGGLNLGTGLGTGCPSGQSYNLLSHSCVATAPSLNCSSGTANSSGVCVTSSELTGPFQDGLPHYSYSYSCPVGKAFKNDQNQNTANGLCVDQSTCTYGVTNGVCMDGTQSWSSSPSVPNPVPPPPTGIQIVNPPAPTSTPTTTPAS